MNNKSFIHSLLPLIIMEANLQQTLVQNMQRVGVLAEGDSALKVNASYLRPNRNKHGQQEMNWPAVLKQLEQVDADVARDVARRAQYRRVFENTRPRPPPPPPNPYATIQMFFTPNQIEVVQMIVEGQIASLRLEVAELRACIHAICTPPPAPPLESDQ
jgi:hypothetical protein